MSLIRTVFWLSVLVMLLPTDERRQAEVAGTAGSAFERAVTFCDRNPGTCAAGSELWAAFVRKAEFGMQLVAKLAREGMAKGPLQGMAPASEPVRPSAATRGTLTTGDLSPQWRGQNQRAAYEAEDQGDGRPTPLRSQAIRY